MLVRNVRRRLYDAINVMISAGIVQKDRNNKLRLAKSEPFSVKLEEGAKI